MVLTGPLVILTLKIAVAAVTVLLLGSPRRSSAATSSFTAG